MYNEYIKKGVKIFSAEGSIQFIKKTLRFALCKTICINTLFIYELDLKKPVKKIDPRTKLSFRLASEDDIDFMEEKRYMMSQKRKKHSKERLEKGDKCVLAIHNDEIVGYSWAMKDAMELSQFNLIPLPENKVYLYNAFVVEEFRGKRVNGAMRQYFDNILINEGKTTIVATISKYNKPSIKSAERMDPKKIGKVTQIRFFGLKYDYISKKDLKLLHR